MFKRTNEEMLRRLKDHLRLLENYIFQYRSERDEALLGEIAGKLRLLVYDKGRNKALLLKIALNNNIELVKDSDRPSGITQLHIKDYLKEVVFYTRDSEMQLVNFTSIEIIEF